MFSILNLNYEKMQLPKLHGCDELPALTKISTDADCLDRIQSVFRPLRWLGDGENGIVLLLFALKPEGKTEELVVKISLAASTETELRIACQLNETNAETPIFPHTYGWLVCDTIPAKWIAILSDEEREHDIIAAHTGPYMFTFIQPVQEKWIETPLVIEERYRTSLFFLLHGLWVARTRIGFVHGDIHGRNIMLQPNASYTKTTTFLRYGEIEAGVECVFVPRLIDYGEAHTQQYDMKGVYKANDLRLVREEFYDRLERDAARYEAARPEFEALKLFIASQEWQRAEAHFDQGSEGILALLQHPYFEIPEIRRERVKQRRIEQRSCFVCCKPNVNQMIEHQYASPKYFCNSGCYSEIHAICQFIK